MSEKITMKVSILSELNQEDLYSLYKKYSNWYELGTKVRSYFNDIRITRIYPNDYELGRVVSDFISRKV